MTLFVYGTLLGGAPQGGLLAGLRRVPAYTQGRLYAMPGGYPALVAAGPGRVYGELVEGVSAQRLALLDTYEGVGEGLYRRVSVDVVVALARVAAEVYVMDAPERRGGLPIPSGRWRRVVRR